MYSTFQLAKKYLRYYLTASNGQGHGIHSPFVFDFITQVLTDKKTYNCYREIEAIRKQLKQNNTVIEVEDFGAGSGKIKSNQRVVKAIASSSLKQPKYAQLLFRMVQYYKPKLVLELGTSLGVTTAYLANGNVAANVYTCEGATQIAAIAQHHFNDLSIKNISIITGDFATTLTSLLQTTGTIDFAFIDGNHRKEPTLQYFQQLLEHSDNNTILVFDDIHWSAGMEEAWAAIQHHPAVTLTIDLFFIGIVCLNKDIKASQHFVIKY
ncbi:class I SAM-dependent methyltransferase [Ferruginibacter paludis]|uniref:O-methyltransferase n=1 Tax=Ferruginibacter paludis TaxID=1310417 RepID=UPI0025B2FE07|nr:class I SAM-dependent methyltransferase [Ferruginibacter paludis]MDN3654474.1 class I SAM-dependent methyltransferase [Ferruginibacter paludis]